MNFLDALHTSSSGLTAQRVRMNVISSNLANMNTTRTSEGGPYRRKDAVFGAQPVRQSFQNMLRAQKGPEISGVRVLGIFLDPRPPISKYDPQHPDADEHGYVSLPNISPIEEMVNMISATRSYGAGVAAINATKNMALKALAIGQ
ncbi:MAG: flagellar basal body rod protein FlgC [Thermodesulfobacteriota bacterium]|nr:flagellar basal body rod protein FlgC [Thermodesulfobacteriota bacterium]